MDWLAQISSITRLLTDESNFGVFLLVTVFLGGGAAWLTGQAAANTWRPLWQVVFYGLVLACAVRFIHYSLFEGTLLSLYFYAIDAAVCLIFGVAGFRVARVAQMVGQYRWLNDSEGPLRWRRKMH